MVSNEEVFVRSKRYFYNCECRGLKMRVFREVERDVYEVFSIRGMRRGEVGRISLNLV